MTIHGVLFSSCNVFFKQGNHSVLKSTDEYTLAVNASRGLKEFQYDQVFMEDSTQEQIFEDTNVSFSNCLLYSNLLL